MTTGEVKSNTFASGAVLIRKDVRNGWKLVLDTKAVDPLPCSSDYDANNLTEGSIITTDIGVYSNKDDALAAQKKYTEGQSIMTIGEGEDNLWTFEFITYKGIVIQLVWCRVRIISSS